MAALRNGLETPNHPKWNVPDGERGAGFSHAGRMLAQAEPPNKRVQQACRAGIVLMFGELGATIALSAYEKPGMNEWVQQPAELFLAPGLPERLRRLREKYLTAEEIRQAEEYERDPF